MSQSYIGEIRMFAGTFAPVGWLFCDGSLLPISENEALFNLIGTTYGGDGQRTFQLPDLRGRLPIHQGNIQGSNFTLGQNGGVEQVTLTVAQIPIHTHPFVATANGGTSSNPNGLLLGSQNAVAIFAETAAAEKLDARTIATVGGSQPHDNLQPYLCVDFIISLFGVYPSPN